MREYCLPKHVHVCIQEELCIWFDELRDTYSGLARVDCCGFGRLIEGWPPDTEYESSYAPSSEAREAAESLVRRGLLTRDFERGKSVVMTRVQLPESSINPFPATRPCVRWHHRLRFLSACVSTFAAFYLVSLTRALAMIKRRIDKDTPSVSADKNQTNDVVAAFFLLRSCCYTVRNKCLFDSFVLAHFLSSYRIYPMFVVGVDESPFRAHAWVQLDGVALNSDAEYTKAFTPILAIGPGAVC